MHGTAVQRLQRVRWRCCKCTHLLYSKQAVNLSHAKQSASTHPPCCPLSIRNYMPPTLALHLALLAYLNHSQNISLAMSYTDISSKQSVLWVQIYDSAHRIIYKRHSLKLGKQTPRKFFWVIWNTDWPKFPPWGEEKNLAWAWRSRRNAHLHI